MLIVCHEVQRMVGTTQELPEVKRQTQSGEYRKFDLGSPNSVAQSGSDRRSAGESPANNIVKGPIHWAVVNLEVKAG